MRFLSLRAWPIGYVKVMRPASLAERVPAGANVEPPEAQVYRQVAVALPGVRVVSAIQGLVYLQRFVEGIVLYEQMPSPSGADDRWVGVCHFQQFDDLKALEAFSRAVAKGEEAARVNLAHVLRFLERGGEGTGELQAVRLDLLNEYDRVFYFRIVSINEENNGNLRESLKAAEEAWKRVQGLPEYPLLAPSILAQLGVLHSRIGRAQRSLWFLDRAIQMTAGVEHLKARLRRSSVLNMLGRHREATIELDSLVLEGLPRNFLPELFFNRGEVAWSAGHLDEAGKEFAACVASCAGMQVAYEEFVARLSLTALCVTGKDYTHAADHLERAQALISDKSDRLNYRFREVQLLFASGTYTAAHALSELEVLDGEFGDMGLLQEQSFVKLHRASILESQGSSRFNNILDEVVALTITLQNRSFLAREWTALPRLKRVARRSHSSLMGHVEAILELHTLGTERIVLAGQPVHMPLRRAPELLAYFLENKAVTFEQVRADLFPGEKLRTAKSYFHQFRHQLKAHVEGLQVEFDRESRMYRLKSEIDVMWDVADLRAGRRKESAGPFLPSSSTDWALTLDHALERYRFSR
jgi:tetratricopeptide (TPR) repeat protein